MLAIQKLLVQKLQKVILILHSLKNVIIIESDSTPSMSSQSTSSYSSYLGDVPLSRIFSTINEGLSPSTKHHTKHVTNTNFEPMNPSVYERIANLSELKIKVCERLPHNHPLQPPMIQPIKSIYADVNIDSSSSQPTSANQTNETSV